MVESAESERRLELRGRRLGDQLAAMIVQGVVDYAIFTLDPEGRVASWNPGAEAILGYADAEIVGRPYQALLEPGAADVSAILAEAAAGGRREAEDWRVRKDGSRVWAHELIAPLRGGDGSLAAFAVLLRDRTERRAANEARIRAEQMFTGIIDTTPDAVVTVDESQRIILFNPAAEAIFGLRAQDAVGQPLDVLIPERHREIHRRHVREFLETNSAARLMGERGRAPLVGLRSDGHVFPIEAAISKTRVGEECVLTAVVRDVSERVRESRAREFLGRAGLILESSLDYQATLHDVARLAIPEWGDWCTVYLPDEHGAIHRIRVAHDDPEMSELARRLEDYPVMAGGDHPARGVIERGEPVLIAEVPASLLEAVAQDEEHLGILRRLGLRSAVIAPLLAHGRALGAIALYSAAPDRRYDAFDLWVAEELGRRAGLALENARLYGEAQQAVRERDDVVSVVSHDLRNPLNSILMSCEMLAERVGTGDEPEALRKLARISVRAAGRMNRMIQDLLDITRLETGRLQLEPRPADPRALLEEAYETLQPLAAEADLRLELDAAPGLPRVKGDPDRLQQVISNLVGNAVKFTAAGGRITVGAKAVPGAVVFSVEDTGVGIPAEHLPVLFDRFWQARRSDRRGIGLGLPIVKGIVEAHGGEVWVESEEGAGTTFFFSIPTAD